MEVIDREELLKSKSCPLCGKNFHRRLSLFRHVHKYHPTVKITYLPAARRSIDDGKIYEFGEYYGHVGTLSCLYRSRYGVYWSKPKVEEVHCQTILLLPPELGEVALSANDLREAFDALSRHLETEEEQKKRLQLKEELQQLRTEAQSNSKDLRKLAKLILREEEVEEEIEAMDKRLREKLRDRCYLPPPCEKCYNYFKCMLL